MKTKMILCALALATASAVGAHHSFAMFDGAKVVTISGTVKEFQWTNPHIWIEVNVPGPRGKVVQWSIEGGAISMLKRQGWSRDAFKAGERVTLSINPLKNGDAGGSFIFARFADGRTLGRPPAAGEGLVRGRGAAPPR